MRGVKKIEVAMGNLIQHEFKSFYDCQFVRETSDGNIGRRLKNFHEVRTPKIEDFVGTQISSNHPKNVTNYCSSKTYDGLTELHAIQRQKRDYWQ